MNRKPGSKPDFANLGTVISVRGSVVDIRFEDRLPPIYTLLRTGMQKEISIEVLSQLDAYRVRGIALTPTQGLARGTVVEDSGGPLQMPVGKQVLSRMFDVFGNTIDRQPGLTDVQWRSVHRSPPSLARRSTKSELFETGIKVIDVLMPLERGGKSQRAAYRAVAGDLKLAYAQFEELETFARFGARLDEDTRRIIEHGRRIRACLKQAEFTPVSVVAQIAVLLALTADLFDVVPLERMSDAELAVRESAVDIPDEVTARFDTADKLSDEDRNTIIDIARAALTSFQPSPDAKSEAKLEVPGKSKRKPDESSIPDAISDIKPKLAAKAKEQS